MDACGGECESAPVVCETTPPYENLIGGLHSNPRSSICSSIFCTRSAPPNRLRYRSRLFSPGEAGSVGSRRKGANRM